MRILIRIEHPDSGFGIFRHNGHQTIIEKLDEPNLFYTKYFSVYSNKAIWQILIHRPYKMTRLEYKQYFSGFKSTSVLKECISQENIKTFIDLGFKIYRIKVSHCIRDDKRYFFKKERIISKTDITNIFNEQHNKQIQDYQHS